MTGDARGSFLAPPAPIVIDASFALEAVLEGGPILDRLGAMATDRRVRLVPPLFWVETANALLRRRGFEPGRAALTLAALARAGIESADRGLAGLADALELGARHDLSVYDAVYLQLAIDVDGELATLDQALMRAASAEGVEVTAIG
jgi:predicted nucleic acid-binding protein